MKTLRVYCGRATLLKHGKQSIVAGGKLAEKYAFYSGVGSVCLSFILELIRKGYKAVSFIFFPDKPLVE